MDRVRFACLFPFHYGLTQFAFDVAGFSLLLHIIYAVRINY